MVWEDGAATPLLPDFRDGRRGRRFIQIRAVASSSSAQSDCGPALEVRAFIDLEPPSAFDADVSGSFTVGIPRRSPPVGVLLLAETYRQASTEHGTGMTAAARERSDLKVGRESRDE